jgi:hypothetical protein
LFFNVSFLPKSSFLLESIARSGVAITRFLCDPSSR